MTILVITCAVTVTLCCFYFTIIIVVAGSRAVGKQAIIAITAKASNVAMISHPAFLLQLLSLMHHNFSSCSNQSIS